MKKAFARGNSTSAKAPSEQNSSARVIMHILARIHESASALGMFWDGTRVGLMKFYEDRGEAIA
uniref:Uncharacterized protein n=1 Tax=Oryza nivara TaxID=4536 RepID=A0A0E0G4Y1_ORYNI